MTRTEPPAVLDRDGLDALVAALVADGRTVVGPTVRDGAIVLAELDSAAELPYGWGVELEAGQEAVTSGVFKLRNGAAVLVNNNVQPSNEIAPKPEDN